MKTFKRIFFGILWFFGILIYLEIAGSQTHMLFGLFRLGNFPSSGETSFHLGREFALHYSLIIFIFALLISVSLSAMGILPGTNIEKRVKKSSLWSIFSFIFGLLYFFAYVVPIIFGVLAIICGIVGWIRTVKLSEKLSGKTWAIMGTGLGVLTIALPMIIIPLVERHNVMAYNEAGMFEQMLTEQRVSSEMKNAYIKPLDGLMEDANSQNGKDRESVIAQIMEIGYIQTFFYQLENLKQIDERFTENLNDSPEDAAKVRQIQQTTYTTDLLKQYIHDSLERYYDSARFNKYINFLKTPLAKKFFEEWKNILYGGDETIKNEAAQFFQQSPSAERYQLVSTHLRLSIIPRLQLALNSFGRVPMLKTMEPALSTEQVLEELTVLIDEFGFPQVNGSMPGLLSKQAYLLRNFSDDEVERYIYDSLDPDISFVDEVIYQSVIEALSILRKDFLRQVRMSVQEIHQPIADRTYGALSWDETLERKREIAEHFMKEGLDSQHRGDQKNMKKALTKAVVILEQLVFLDSMDTAFKYQLVKAYQALQFRLNRAEALLMNQ